MRDLVCERCGAAFTCGNGAPGCWCHAKVSALPGLQKTLGRSYDDCLCEECLTALIGERDSRKAGA
jgi:hypothetical protein